MWSLHVLPVLRGFPPGPSIFPAIKTCMLGVSLIWNRSPGAALWLPTAPQEWLKCRDQISL